MNNNKSLAKNAVLNSLKTIMGMIFPLITFPYASRVLGVENIGKVNFAVSIASYFVLLAGLGIKTYAIREGARIREDYNKLCTFSCEIFSINTLSTIGAVILYCLVILNVQKLESYRILLLIQSLSIIGPTIGVEWLYTIHEDYMYMTMRSIIVQLVSMVLLFALVHTKSDYIIYNGISVFAASASYVFNFFHAKKYTNLKFTWHINLKKHMKSIMIIFAMAVATTIYVNSDTTMLGIMVGDYYVGIYNAATKMYNILKNLMAACILVALPRLSNYYANNRMSEYKREASNILNTFLLLLLPTVVGVFMTAKEIIIILAGKEYLQAVSALQILSISLLFSIIATYMTHVVLLPAKCEAVIMRATFVSAGVNVLMNIFMIPYFKHNGAAFTTLIAELIVMIWQIYRARNIERAMINKKDFTLVVGGCILIVVACLGIDKLNINLFIKVGVKVIVSAILYTCVLILGKHTCVRNLVEKIKNN